MSWEENHRRAQRLAELGREMRKRQQTYFRKRDRDSLIACKDAEGRYDRESEIYFAHLNHPQSQPSAELEIGDVPEDHQHPWWMP